MRFSGVVLAGSLVVLGACGGGEKAATPAPAANAPAAASAPAAPAAAGTAMPITGKTYEVKMIMDAKGYRFEPATITAKAGDGIKFTSVSGGPHNIAFQPTAIPDGAKSQLDANFGTDRMGEMSSGLKNDNDTFTLSLGGLKPGKYEFNCTPHLAMNMKGTLTIEP